MEWAYIGTVNDTIHLLACYNSKNIFVTRIGYRIATKHANSTRLVSIERREFHLSNDGLVAEFEACDADL